MESRIKAQSERKGITRNLSIRQARAAVITAFALGALFSALQISFDLRSERQRVDDKYSQLLRTVEDSAVQATYRLDALLAQRVVEGLFQYKAIFHADITDDFGDQMAIATRPETTGGMGVVASTLFGSAKKYSLALRVPELDTTIGSINVWVDTNVIAETFFERSSLILIFGMLRSLLLAGILAVLYHYMLTRPLRVVVQAIKRGDVDVPVPPTHEDDELGDLVHAHTELVEQIRSTESELRVNQEILQRLVDNLPEFVSFKDIDRRFLFVNKRFEEWVGLDQQDVQGKTVYDIYSREQAEEFDAQDQEAIANRQVISREVEMPFPDGKIRPVLSTRFPVISSANEVIGLGTINVDLTAVRKSEDSLQDALADAERANQAKSEFLATMSHEFRTPLNAILGFSEMMRAQYFGPLGSDNYTDYAGDIHLSGEHMLELVNDILDIAAIEAGNREIDVTAVDVKALLIDCLKNVTKAATDKGVEISMEIPDYFPTLHADKRAVKQVAINLLSNSVKFTERGGTIAVSALATESHAVLIFKDTGIGIPPDVLPTITDPFARVHSDSTITQEGTGLGLSIVSALVKTHNGTMDISSKLGHGTTITVTLPLGSHEQD